MSLEPSPLDETRSEIPEILDEVRAMISDVIGDEYVSEIEIGPDTAFYGDLEIESIEFVALGEQLQEKYGERIDFAAWIATMDIDDITAMTVGRLVDYIVASIGDGERG